jgi:hypothetical protein
MSDWLRQKDSNGNGFVNHKKKLQVILCEQVGARETPCQIAWQALLACYADDSTMVPSTIAMAETEEAMVESVEDFLDAADQYQSDFITALRELSTAGLVIRGTENATAFHDRDLRPTAEQLSTLLIGGRYYGADCYLAIEKFDPESFAETLARFEVEAGQVTSILRTLSRYKISSGKEEAAL